MSPLIAIAENLLLIVALPWLVSDASRDLVGRIDNRGMFSIPFCRMLAVASGGLLAIATGVLAGLQTEISVANLWDSSGFWHGGRFLIILERYTDDLWSLSHGPNAARHLLFAQIVFASAAFLAASNFAIAAMGWRSPAAIRGLIAHLVISISVWLVLTIRALAAIWVLHWLNFWVLLILLVVLELRRREVGTTRLSF